MSLSQEPQKMYLMEQRVSHTMTGVNVTPSDFVLNSLVGNFEINNNTATIVIGIQDDIEAENLESVGF